MSVLSVSQLNGYVKELLEDDVLLEDVTVCGEISNYKKHSSGHMYFTLKDASAAINAAMFKWMAQYLRFAPSNGLRVIARGKVTLYEPTGQYQLIVQSMQPDGEGALYAQYEKLKARLEAEGLFSQDKKRPLPKFPKKIGVITSKTGAAVKDIFSVLGRRWPLAEIVFSPAIVQGVEAPRSLISALERINNVGDCAVLIIGRGGGSIEDLWAFNDEALVRTVAASKTIVISAVGHETDFTLCDFAADLRAPTPSAAAELAVPDIIDQKLYVDQLGFTLEAAQRAKINELAHSFNMLVARSCFSSPFYQIDVRTQRADLAADRIRNSIAFRLSDAENRLSFAAKRLCTLNPMSVLARGYCCAYKGEMPVVSSETLVHGDSLELHFFDGKINCVVD